MNSPNPTAEPLKSWEVNSNAWDAFSGEEHLTNGIQAAYEAGLRAHGRLSEGAPSEERRGINLMRDLGFDESDPKVIKARADAAFEEQIERAAVAIRNTQVGGASYRPAEMPVTSAHREQARAALTASGAAPQKPQALAPEKVADVIHHAFPADSPYRCTHIINAPCVALATALCEAAKRGELT